MHALNGRSMKYLIAGLGNPGLKYAQTRHNIGFDILDRLAKESGSIFETDRHADRAEVKFKKSVAPYLSAKSNQILS